MKRNTLALMLAAVGVSVLAVNAVSASNPESQFGQGCEGQGGGALKEAIESGDTSTIESLFSEKFDVQINDETALEFIQAHENQDHDAIEALMDELGIEPPQMGHHGPGMMGGGPFKNLDLTDEEKDQLKEAHELMRSGDQDGAKEIFDSLGLELPPEEHDGEGFGFKGPKNDDNENNQ